MPELPEVEVTRRGLEASLVGRRFESVDVRFPLLREPVPVELLEAHVPGREVLAVRRRAKYLIVDLEGGWSLVVHLGMSGRLELVETDRESKPHEHVVFGLDDRQEMRFRDPRRFGLVQMVPTAGLEEDRHFAHLGVEPLPQLEAETLRSLAAGRKAPIKSFVMDGRIVVGVGNIYACESLFRSGIHPRRAAGRIGAERWELLAEEIVAVLEEAIEQGGTTLNDFAAASGEPGYFQVSLSVYGREGETCERCAGTIRRIVQSNRSTFYCPGCQR